MDNPIRIGAVNYLNTKPLICDLDVLASDAELVLDVPSRLADMLAAGELDVALVPAIEYFRSGSYSIVPDVSIATRGPVLSVTLFSRRRGTASAAWHRRRIAPGAALTQILLRKRRRPSRRDAAAARLHDAEDVEADAVLLDWHRPCGPVCRASPTPTTSVRSGTIGPACRSSTPSGPCGRASI